MTYLFIYDPASGQIWDYRKICSTPAQETALAAATPNAVVCPIQPDPSWLKNASIDIKTKAIIGMPTSSPSTVATSAPATTLSAPTRTSLAKMSTTKITA